MSQKLLTLHNLLNCSDFSEIQNGTVTFAKKSMTAILQLLHAVRWAGVADRTSSVCIHFVCYMQRMHKHLTSIVKNYRTMKIKQKQLLMGSQFCWPRMAKLHTVYLPDMVKLTRFKECIPGCIEVPAAITWYSKKSKLIKEFFCDSFHLFHRWSCQAVAIIFNADRQNVIMKQHNGQAA